MLLHVDTMRKVSKNDSSIRENKNTMCMRVSITKQTTTKKKTHAIIYR